MNIPNMITLFRLFLIPIFAYLMIIKDYTMATAILLLSGCSDILDGYIARKYNMTTKLGTLMDPIVDKLMQITGLGLLALSNQIPFVRLAFCIVVTKEIIMLLGGAILYKKDIIVNSNIYGKIATIVIYISIILGILCSIFDYTIYAEIFMIASIVVSILALIMYFKGFLKLMKKAQ